jgi:hypothetical protein
MRLFANLGLRQTWLVREHWSIDAGLDRSQTVKHPGTVPFDSDVPPSSGTDNDFTAVSAGAAYREERWTSNARVELRYSDDEDKWAASAGIYGEPRDGLGMSASAQVLRTSSSRGVDRTSSNIRLGLAHRPEASKWIVLDRLDLRLDGLKTPERDIDSRRVINNLNLSFVPQPATQIALQYGAKYVKDDYDGYTCDGYTDLMGLEARHDLRGPWDVGIRGSVLHSWNANQFDYSAGISLGYNIVENAWVSAGYNILGFEDRDFSCGSFTARGPFIRFRIKVDQESLSDALNLLKREQGTLVLGR